jgi:hypothetical protein
LLGLYVLIQDINNVKAKTLGLQREDFYG